MRRQFITSEGSGQRRLFAEEPPKTQTLAELLEEMQCVMRGHQRRGWDARAIGCEKFAHAATPVEAMREALRIRDQR